MLCEADNVDDVVSLLVTFQVVGVMFVPVLWWNSVGRLNFFATKGEGIFGSEVTLPNIPKVAVFPEGPGPSCKVHKG